VIGGRMAARPQEEFRAVNTPEDVAKVLQEGFAGKRFCSTWNSEIQILASRSQS